MPVSYTHLDVYKRQGLELQKHDVFAIVIGKGIRVSVASNTEEECRIMPAKIKAAIESCK